MSTNNPITEISAVVLAALFILAAALLVYAGKIDFTAATSMFVLAGAIYGGNLALKAPSPTQQAQIGQIADRQQLLTSQQQGLTSQVLSVLPQVVSATQSAPAPQPVGQVPHPKDGIRVPTDPTPPTGSRVSAQQLLAQPDVWPNTVRSPDATQGEVTPPPINPWQTQAQFQAGNTFPVPIVPQE